MVNLETILFPQISDKKITLVLVITIAFLLIDTMINNVSDFLVPQTTSKWGVTFFVILAIVFAISQYLLLRFVWWKTKNIRSKSLLINGFLKVVIASQYTLLAFLIIIIYQILFRSQYNTALLIWTTLISFLLSISLLGVLARQFFLWYRSYKKESFIIVSYTLAFVIMSITFSLGLFFDLYNFSSKQELVGPNSEVSFPNYDNAGRLVLVLHYIYDYSDLISFILIWAATALLLLHYRRRLGVVKFWIMITLPLIYYLSTFVDIIGFYKPQSDLEQFYYYLYTSLNSTAGGIMFGIAFITIAKRIDNQIIKGYMTLASYGFILLYISSQITLVACSYPPFGITTLFFAGLSSFLLLTGLYSTAISLSKHAELRKSIRNSIEGQHSRLIDHIGMSEVQRDIDRRVTPLIQRYAEQLNTQTSIDLTISENEVKQYIEEILHDLSKK
jgi:hypothetical protein